MKVLIIGCGGIGSYLVENINKAIMYGQIPMGIPIYAADFDTVEMKNLSYQNFRKEDILKPKCEVLVERYDYLAGAVNKKITGKELKEYDMFILCADNFTVRNEVIEYCHKNKKNFIDLRAEGRNIFVMLKGESMRDDLDTLQYSKESGSCQKEYDMKMGFVQYGNLIVAAIGLQTFINVIRNNVHTKRILLHI